MVYRTKNIYIYIFTHLLTLTHTHTHTHKHTHTHIYTHASDYLINYHSDYVSSCIQLAMALPSQLLHPPPFIVKDSIAKSDLGMLKLVS